MLKNVALKIESTPSTTYHKSDTDKKGAWQVVTEETTKTAYLSEGKQFFLVSATTKFDYIGGSSGGSSIGTPSETLELKPKKTLLTENGSSLLVDGDSIGSENGNSIKVKVKEIAKNTRTEIEIEV